MSTLAICDFDGVIADIAEHVRIAQERAQAFMLQQTANLDDAAKRKALSQFFYSEQGFFDTRLIEYDQLMSGCQQALARLMQAYDKVVVVTSRPSSMREATLRWFTQLCPGCEHIEFFFKETSESAMKTAIWKTNMVTHFTEHYDTILFIDDDERNRQAIELLSDQSSNVHFFIKSCLEECL